MALENIITSIQEEASKEADALLKNAKSQVSEIEKKSQKEVAAAEDALNKRVQEAVDEISHKVSLEMTSKKKHMLLNAKREALSQVFNESLEKLSSLDESSYVSLMTSLLKEIDGKDFILHSAKGKEDQLKKAVSEAGSSYELGDSIDSRGGFTAVSNSVEVNLTFEALLDSMKDSLELDVSQKLFS